MCTYESATKGHICDKAKCDLEFKCIPVKEQEIITMTYIELRKAHEKRSITKTVLRDEIVMMHHEAKRLYNKSRRLGPQLSSRLLFEDSSDEEEERAPPVAPPPAPPPPPVAPPPHVARDTEMTDAGQYGHDAGRDEHDKKHEAHLEQAPVPRFNTGFGGSVSYDYPNRRMS
jgi:hypothetical protein